MPTLACLKYESIEPKSISLVCFYAENLYQVLIIYIEMFLYLMGKWPIATEFVSFLSLDILWEFQENLQF